MVLQAGDGSQQVAHVLAYCTDAGAFFLQKVHTLYFFQSAHGTATRLSNALVSTSDISEGMLFERRQLLDIEQLASRS